MNKRQRIRAALNYEPVDRIPLSLWRHYHCEDRTPEGLAETTLTLARTYDLDLVKLTPCGLYAVEDWAGERIVYPNTDHDAPYLHASAVRGPAGWRRLTALEPTQGTLGRELTAIRFVTEGLAEGGTPFMMTVFSPLTLAFKLAGDDVVEHLRGHPGDLHAGLQTLAQTTVRFARAALAAGADGLFFATQMASPRWLSAAEYAEFGERYDLAVLEALSTASAITVLHLHGRDVYFDLVNRYPVHAVSWHNQETPPHLSDARQRTDRAFITGLDRELLEYGPESAIQSQVRQAVAQTEGRGLILAPSCVIPTTTLPAHLQAVRDAIPARSTS
jgi:uroporphyrinogen decarboxylase